MCKADAASNPDEICAFAAVKLEHEGRALRELVQDPVNHLGSSDWPYTFKALNTFGALQVRSSVSKGKAAIDEGALRGSTVCMVGRREHNPMFFCALSGIEPFTYKKLMMTAVPEPIIRVSDILNSRSFIPDVTYSSVNLSKPMDNKYCMITCFDTQEEVDSYAIDCSLGLYSCPHATMFSMRNNDVLHRSDIHWTTDVNVTDATKTATASLVQACGDFKDLNKPLKANVELIYSNCQGFIDFLNKYVDGSCLSNEEKLVNAYTKSQVQHPDLSVALKQYATAYPTVSRKLHFYYKLDKLSKASAFSALTLIDKKRKKPSRALTAIEVTSAIAKRKPIAGLSFDIIDRELKTANSKITAISSKIFSVKELEQQNRYFRCASEETRAKLLLEEAKHGRLFDRILECVPTYVTA